MVTDESEYLMCPTPEELAALYDNALPKRRSRSLREHLVRCQRCCEDVRFLGAVRRLSVGQKKPAAAIERFFSRGMAAFEERSAKKIGIPRPLRPKGSLQTEQD